MRISDWSSDVCSSDLVFPCVIEPRGDAVAWLMAEHDQVDLQRFGELLDLRCDRTRCGMDVLVRDCAFAAQGFELLSRRSEARRVGQACVSPCRSRWSPYH